ncbi:MAG TPA: GGDEF domain-containing protein [Actinoplanes sp.]|nr:GGDEF domain-containing protein [Actinoplanes sp.]
MSATAAQQAPGRATGVATVVLLARDRVLQSLAAAGALGAAWCWFNPGTSALSWFGQVVLDAVTLVLSARIATDRAVAGPIRRFWFAMAVAAGFFTAGDSYQTLRLLRHPDNTDASLIQLSLVFIGVCVVVGTMLTHPLRAVGRERLRLWLDTATVLVAVAVFGWYFLVGETIGTSKSSQLAASSAAAAMMTVSAFGILKLMFSGLAPFTLTTGIVGVTAVAATTGATSLGGVTSGRSVLLLQVTAGVLLAAVPRIQALQMGAAVEDATTRRRRSYSRLPYLAVIATQGLLIVGMLHTGLEARTWGVAVGVVAITGLVLVRQLVAFHDNTHLLASLNASMSEAYALQEQLRHKATHDTLTLLANRALFDERIKRAQEADSSAGAPVAVLLIDLDDFKQVNDTLGHHVGDGLLIAVADRLRQCVRQTDTVARLGGDEFAVLLPAATPEDARAVADRMTAALQQPAQVEGHRLPLRASIGVATGSVSEADWLLRAADLAMYEVKQNGKGGYRLAGGHSFAAGA